jgi:hypothetical protein
MKIIGPIAQTRSKSTERMASMDEKPILRTPRKWLRINKYLLPVGYDPGGTQRTKAPLQQVKIAQLAADHPDQVRLQTK